MKMLNPRVWIGILIAAFALPAKAQFDAQFSQYWVARNYFNPAAAGLGDELNLAMQFRQQWVGVENAPATFLFSGELPATFLGKRHGMGLILSNETIGLYSNLALGVQYAYALPLWGGKLSIGGQVGVLNSKFDGTKVDIPTSGGHNPNDPSIPSTEENGMAFDAAAGLFFHHKRLHAGLSMTHLTQSAIQLSENIRIYVPSTIYLTAGYNHSFSNSLVEFRPSLLLKSDRVTTQIDLNALFWYNNRLFGGIGYRWGDALSVTVGAEFSNIRVGYSYDLGMSAIGRASGGSHELFVGYRYRLDFDRNLLNQGRKRSVRFL